MSCITRICTSLLAVSLICANPARGQVHKQDASAESKILAYIDNSWGTLSRSMIDCKSLVDAKVTTAPILYLPAGMASPAAVSALEQQCNVTVRHLPNKIEHMGDVRVADIPVEGLLYLPNRYVVPGGRFNEMYGWDSYFIILGLVEDNQTELAKGMVENFFFEIENYGAILNANRTYYFTRSQPPFLSSMIREVHARMEDNPASKAWLAKAYDFAKRDYALWTSPIHRAGDTGLARYRDLGEGPVPEMADDSTYYPDVIRWLLAHPNVHTDYLSTPRIIPRQSKLQSWRRQAATSPHLRSVHRLTSTVIGSAPPSITETVRCENPASTPASASGHSADRPMNTHPSASTVCSINTSATWNTLRRC